MISRLTSALSRLPSSLSFAFFSSSKLSAAQKTQKKMDVKQFVEDSIAAKKVVIFSKTWCPYSQAVKELFNEKYPGVDLAVFELDKRSDGSAIQAYLAEKTNQRTVPNVFVNKQHIGGCDNTVESFESGQLTKLIQAED